MEMKVAIFTDTYEPQVNGVARTLKRWADYLGGKGVSYRVFAPDTSHSQEYTENIHRFKSLPFWLYPECRLALPKPSYIKTELENFQPDLIHIATPFNIGLTGLYYAKKMNLPIVGSYHTHFDQYLDYYKLSFLSPFVWKYLHWFHQSFKTTYVPSFQTKRELERHGFTNINLWRRGVDSQHYRPLEGRETLKRHFNIQAPHLLTYVGRLAPEKGLDVLMKTTRLLPGWLNKDVHWLIVGDGPLYDAMKAKAPANMTFAGYQQGVMLSEIYASSSLFVFPSQTETFGNVVLESLSCGTPAIVARAGGVLEIVEHDKTGLLCQPGDPASFKDAIVRLLTDQDLLSSMRIAAREEAMRRSWDDVFEQLLNDYKEAIGGMPSMANYA